MFIGGPFKEIRTYEVQEMAKGPWGTSPHLHPHKHNNMCLCDVSSSVIRCIGRYILIELTTGI